MSNHVYKLLELAGSSTTSIEDAVQKAIAAFHADPEWQRAEQLTEAGYRYKFLYDKSDKFVVMWGPRETIEERIAKREKHVELEFKSTDIGLSRVPNFNKWARDSVMREIEMEKP